MILEWVDKKDGDYIDPEDINKVAKGILELEKEVDRKVEEEYVDGKIDWVKITNKTISADEAGVQIVDITKDDAGNAFNLKRLYVFVGLKTKPAAKGVFSIYAKGSVGGDYFVYLDGASRYFVTVSERIAEGRWNNASYNGETIYYNTVRSGYIARGVDYINKVLISYDVDEGFAEGTVIEVYGVKA